MMRFLSASSAMAIAMAAQPAIAQDNQNETAREPAGLSEITVTAQRREESLQDAALPIDALSPDQLTRQGVESAQDLGRISPSLGANAGGGPLTSLFVRGVGALTVNSLQDSGVAQNYDGVYLGRSSSAAGLNFYDMERVELLKGPQGTLYGRNATGGVLNYIPKKPELGEIGGYVQGSYGNFDAFAVQGAVNLPVADTVAFRVAGSHQDRDGFNDDGTSDLDAQSVRAQLLFEPSNRFNARFAVDHTEVGGKGVSGSLLGFFGTAPGTHSPIPLEFRDTAGSSCGALLPTGNAMDIVEGVACTLIDNGMPCVVFKAEDIGATGYESREELESESFAPIREKIEAIRLAAGPMMNLGNVREKTVPKMTLVAPPRNAGAVTTRVFIPHRAHASIGALGAVTAATACLVPGSPAHEVSVTGEGKRKTLSIEHPTGEMSCVLETDAGGAVTSAALLRTARKLMDGEVFA